MSLLKALVLPARACGFIWQAAIGWWIGRKRGWTPDTRGYGGLPGLEVRLGSRGFWWDDISLTEIRER